MKIVCVSDTHRLHRQIKVPRGDVFIHAGDIGLEFPITETVLWDFNKWLAEIPCKHKIVIGGNHDWLLHDMGAEAAAKELSAATYLCDSGVNIDGVHFYGSPWQPEFCGWAWNLPRGDDLKEKWQEIPENTNVLITHGPAYGVLDSVFSEKVGDWDLLERMYVLPKLKLHVCGHIHYSYGTTIGRGKKNNRIQFVNASTCTEEYLASNKPITLNLRNAHGNRSRHS